MNYSEKDVADLSIEQARCLALPLRSRLMQVLMSRGDSTAAELAQELGLKEKSVYYHLRLLTNCGLAGQVGQRSATTRPEAVFRPLARGLRLGFSGSAEGSEVLRKSFRSLLSLLRRDHDKALLQARTNDRIRIQLMLLKLSEEDERELVRRLKELRAWAESRRDAAGQTSTLATVLLPEVGSTP
jgi:predicted ArsR family transcriptional regulator